jgi:hypothetical protein
MKRFCYLLSGSVPGSAQSLLFMLAFAFVGFSCTSSKHTMTSQPASLAVAQAPTEETMAAAAQSTRTSVGVMQQDNTPEVGELMASNANTVVKDVKKEKLRQKLVQLQSQLEKMKAEKAAQTEVNPDAKPAKTPLTARLLMNKLMKKTNKVSHQRINQINDTEATKANSAGSLVYLGVILAAVGLILALVTTGSAASAGVVILIVGIVMAVVGLLA